MKLKKTPKSIENYQEKLKRINKDLENNDKQINWWFCLSETQVKQFKKEKQEIETFFNSIKNDFPEYFLQKEKMKEFWRCIKTSDNTFTKNKVYQVHNDMSFSYADGYIIDDDGDFRVNPIVYEKFLKNPYSFVKVNIKENPEYFL